MSKRHPAKQCGKKHRYDSEYDARAGMLEHHGDDPRFNVYLCPHCQFWHVGHRIRETA